jgi:hypothetical protein
VTGALSNEPVVKISCHVKSHFPAAAGVDTMAEQERGSHHPKTPGLIGTGDTIVVSLWIERAGMCYRLIKNKLLPF